MIVIGALGLLLGCCNLADTNSIDAVAWMPDTVRVLATPDQGRDTVRKRRRSVEVSDWYSRRLTIHRYVAYATVPVFALQYAAGTKLYDESASAPGWAKTTHRYGATTLAAMFTVNTVTGAWNWWESRTVSEGRVRRTLHAITILAADAAFTYAGVKLSDEAENSQTKRDQHRTVALSAIGLKAVSGIAMKLLNK
jgi:hypothetical protein